MRQRAAVVVVAVSVGWGMLLFAEVHGDGRTGSGLLLVAIKGEQSLGIIDPESGERIAAVPVGGVTGHEVVASPDGRTAYVPVYGNSGVGRPGTDGRKLTVIDIAAQKAIGELGFDHGVRPHCAVFGPHNSLLYVTTELDNSVSVIDARALRILGAVPTGQSESHMLAITRDGRLGYTANVGPGTVSVLDLDARKTLAVIPVARTTQRISLSVDDRFAFTSDQNSPRLAVIDTASNSVRSWVQLPGVGYGTAPTKDGHWLLVAIPSAGKVAVLDLQQLAVVRTIDVPRAPQEVLVRPDNQVAYVSCDVTGKVAAIRIHDWNVERIIEIGKGADGLAWASSK